MRQTAILLNFEVYVGQRWIEEEVRAGDGWRTGNMTNFPSEDLDLRQNAVRQEKEVQFRVAKAVEVRYRLVQQFLKRSCIAPLCELG